MNKSFLTTPSVLFSHFFDSENICRYFTHKVLKIAKNFVKQMEEMADFCKANGGNSLKTSLNWGDSNVFICNRL